MSWRGALVVVVVAVAACGEDDPHADAPRGCKALIEACHDADKGPVQRIHECHMEAERGDELHCARIERNCLAVCRNELN